VPADQLLILAIVQGLTEFLPVSSSGHLVLVAELFGTDQGQAIDVAVHLGSLLAVVVYFWRDVGFVLGGLGDFFRSRQTDARRIFLLLALASIPLVIVGYILTTSGAEDAMRSTTVIGWMTIIFAVVLWLADRYGAQRLSFRDIGIVDAIVVGLAQCLALIPGVSRSGITMSAGRALGFRRTEAARFALLLSIPAILASAGGIALDLEGNASDLFSSDALIAAALSAVAAFISISFMMWLLRRVGMTPFVVYRLMLGAVLLWLAYR
jgi:undecaprenyl-diphosphatase